MSGIKTTVSIALCTYNGEEFIQRQLDSYFRQTVLPDEIVVCDDGSVDSTAEIIKKFAAENPGIRWNISRNEYTIGAARNFERAIQRCTGDLIFLSDQDDVWEVEKIEQTVVYFNLNPECSASFSNASLIDGEDKELSGTLLDTTIFKETVRKNHQRGDLLYWNILFGNVLTGATMAIRRGAIPDIIPFHLDLGRKLWHDGWIGLSLMSGGKVQYIDKPLIKYRVHAAQQVGIVIRDDPFEKYIFQQEEREDLTKEYFQRYLVAFATLQKLKEVKPVDPSTDQKITGEYLALKNKYFKSQPFPERKLRLLKWYLKGVNHISFRDLMTL